MNKLSEDKRKNYQSRKDTGCCPRCGKKKRKSEKFIYCDDCREYYRDYGGKIAEKTNKKRKAVYTLRQKNHQCGRCGVKLGKNYTKKMCVKCLEKARAQNQK